MLIFGFGPGKAQDLGEVVSVTCPFCHNSVYLHHARSKKALRLYFVPVVPYGSDEYLICPVCTRGLQLTKEQVSLVRPMQDTTAAYKNGRLDATAYQDQVDQFWRNLGIRPETRSAPSPAPTADSAAASGGVADLETAGSDSEGRSWIDQLDDLERLHSEGVIDDAQYAAARRRLIDGA